MRAYRDQEKTACGNMQLQEVLESGIEVATNTVVQRRLGRAIHRRRAEESRIPSEEEDKDEVEEEEQLTVETEGTEEEAAEILELALEMEVKEEGEGEEGDDGTIRALGAIEFLTPEADLSVTTLVDACNGFNELSRLATLWTVQHRWLEEKRFTLNRYRHWAQLHSASRGSHPLQS